MFCSRCQSPIPDHFLACPHCIAHKANVELRAMQHAPLRRVAKGELNLAIERFGRHIRLFGWPRSFCGAPLAPADHSTQEAALDSPEFQRACHACRVALDELMTEAIEWQRQTSA